jgi:uncharacterized membrane protein
LSQEARSYSALGILTIGSYLALDRALQSGRWRDWVLHGLVTALAFYCHSYAVFIILAQALFVFSRRSWAGLAGLLASGMLNAARPVQLWLTSNGYRSDLEAFPGVRLYQPRSEEQRI